MGRHLWILRHAKSSWDDPGLDDHDRPLAPRGQKALRKIRNHLATAEHPPELVLCSTARRAVDTFDGVRHALPSSTLVEIEAELYLADVSSMIVRLRGIDAEVGSAMIVGHNPGLHDLALNLASTGDPEQLRRLRAKFPTGAVATIRFEGDWRSLGSEPGRLEDYFTPRPPR